MKKQICVIEDDPDLEQLILLALKSKGYTLQIQKQGTAGDIDGATLADLYIVDVNLGNGVSGVDVCKNLKSYSTDGKRPIVILISAFPELKQLAEDACADDLLPKPFTVQDLLQKVARHLPD